ncbi:MAG: hypothetical protein ACRELF_14085, partial [Gemmataceae bacterium]
NNVSNQIDQPRHEALGVAQPSRSLSIVYPPPQPLAEQPTQPRPSGDDVVWVAGYWSWDTQRDQWRWIGGLWVHAPPGRRWTPGYWNLAADGWRWIAGFWSIVPSPPPYSPPTTPLCASNMAYFDDPAFGLFGPYGTWWPYYYPYSYRNSRPFEHPRPSEVSTHPGPIPSGAMPTLASDLHEPSPPSAAALDRADLPKMDLASAFAAVPKPLAASMAPPPMETASWHDRSGSGVSIFLHHREGGLASILLHPHLESALHHDMLTYHDAAVVHPFGGEHEFGHAPAGGFHLSGEHGGGHGR